MGCRKLSYYEGEGGEEKSPLRIFPCIEEKNDSSIFCIDYSPFGLTFNSYSRTASTPQNFKYNGKEFDKNVEWHSYGSRNYDAGIARWINIDPAADLMHEWSIYNFNYDNPINYIDPDGSIPWPLKKMYNGFARKAKPDDYFGNPRTGKGYAKGYRHAGLDLNFSGGGNTDRGAPVLATHGGKVVEVRKYSDPNNKNSAGTYIKIQAPDGSFRTVYMHLDEASVKKGETVTEGQQIGTLGGSGGGQRKKHTAHLHYEIRKMNDDGGYNAVNPQNSDGSLIDPQKWIDGAETREKINELDGKLMTNLKESISLATSYLNGDIDKKEYSSKRRKLNNERWSLNEERSKYD
jgi:RHS repeat-associated protein